MTKHLRTSLLLVFASVSFLALCAFAQETSPIYRGSVSPRPAASTTAVTEHKKPDKKHVSAQKAVSPAAKKVIRQTVRKKSASPKTVASFKKKALAGKKVTKKNNLSRKKDLTAQKKTTRVQKKDTTKGTLTKATRKRDLRLNVKAAILVNMSTGAIYFEQNPDKPVAPASITKLLTLYLVREALAQGKLSSGTRIPVSARAARTGGSRMNLRRGEKAPLGELIKGISIVSANNACVAVAEYLGKGDPGRFVSRMNDKAKKIGMTKSRFKNPNGLPAKGQLSTARDIARLSVSYLRSFPESLAIHSQTSHTYRGATHRNANSLLRSYKGADGLKTGFVCASGYNITATAKRGQTRLVAVVLGARNSIIRQVETRKLLDYGFKRAAQEERLARKNPSKRDSV